MHTSNLRKRVKTAQHFLSLSNLLSVEENFLGLPDSRGAMNDTHDVCSFEKFKKKKIKEIIVKFTPVRAKPRLSTSLWETFSRMYNSIQQRNILLDLILWKIVQWVIMLDILKNNVVVNILQGFHMALKVGVVVIVRGRLITRICMNVVMMER